MRATKYDKNVMERRQEGMDRRGPKHNKQQEGDLCAAENSPNGRQPRR